MKAKIIYKLIDLKDIVPGDTIKCVLSDNTEITGNEPVEIGQLNLIKALNERGHYKSFYRAEIVFDDNAPIKCPCCESEKTYLTLAIHCNHCAVTTEIDD